MFLTEALQGRQASLADAETTYKQHVCTVTQTVTAVLTSQLPTLSSPPPDWASYATAYGQASAEALTWVNQVMGHLLSVPDDVRSYNDTVTLALADAQSQATALVADPADPVALRVLNHDLSTVQGQLNLVVSFVSGAVTAVQSFQNTLPDLATQLHAIATAATQDAGADQAQIDQLRADIQALQDDISRLTAAIVALGIADAAAITLATVATIAAWPVGAVAWLFAGPVVAVATTFIALDAIQIKTDKAKIESDQNQITGLTADVAALHLLADKMTTLVTQTEALTTDLQAILAEWQTLESEVTQAVTTIQTAITQAAGQASSQAFQAVSQDLTSAVTVWGQAYAQAGSLHLDLRVNTGNIQLGMSPTEVQNTLDTGTQVDIISYLNHIGQINTIRQPALTTSRY